VGDARASFGGGAGGGAGVAEEVEDIDRPAGGACGLTQAVSAISPVLVAATFSQVPQGTW
jgi:hypothetical protein